MRRGLAGFDWANQPNPFRRFKGSLVVPLPLVSGEGMLAYDRLFRPAEGGPGSPLDRPSGLFFELSLGLSAWKDYRATRTEDAVAGCSGKTSRVWPLAVVAR